MQGSSGHGKPAKVIEFEKKNKESVSRPGEVMEN